MLYGGWIMPTYDTPDYRRLYRMPWTAADNAMVWLEPTRTCNLTCDACFVENLPDSHKTMGEIEEDIETILRLCRTDSILIAGGEPLVHPDIIEIVRRVKATGAKAILFTNGVNLDPPLIRELRDAGVYGITVHIDSHQSRTGWIGCSEKDLNDLRQQYADMLYDEGRVCCAFNTTIFPDALHEVPDIVEWVVRNPVKVHIMSLVCVRMVHPDDPWDYYVGDRRVDFGETPLVSEQYYEHLKTPDIYHRIREALPDFDFCSFLGGTVHPDSLKWTTGCRISSSKHSYGNMGPRSMELMQCASHAFRGRYLSYVKAGMSSMGRSALLLGIVDPEMRKTARRYLAAVMCNPLELFRRLHIQSINVVQPSDILPTGEIDRCDGCPNKTPWQGRLVRACQIEEYRMFGAPVRAVPRNQQGGHYP
jgi:MoaA/NifB/PqqE/SkfB family radical SAM enzyme